MTGKKRVWGFVCLITIIVSVNLYAAKQLDAELESIFDSSIFEHSVIGLSVMNLDDGETVYSLNDNKLFHPASNVKLFTVATALHYLGADYRFKTRVYVDGQINDKKTLNGNLVLVASGDVNMGSRTYGNDEIAYTDFDHADANILQKAVLTTTDPLKGIDELASQVVLSGIKKITGEVIIDDRLYDTVMPAESEKDFVISPIVINDNLIDFTIIPGTKVGDAAKVRCRPAPKFLKVKVVVKTVEKNNTAEIKIEETSDNELIVKGVVPFGHKPIIGTYQIMDPASYARSLFIEALESKGIQINASVLEKNPIDLLPPEDKYVNLSPVATLISPPFSEYAKLILKVSHNLGADSLIMIIAAHFNKKTFEAGLEKEYEYLKEIGIDSKSISLNDGEGGLMTDLCTPKSVVTLLKHMKGTPYYDVYLNALPILGVDGTLAHIVAPSSPAKGKVFAKTGTTILGGNVKGKIILLTRGLAGYITSKKGKKLIFALYINNAIIKNLKDVFSIANITGKICEHIYSAN